MEVWTGMIRREQKLNSQQEEQIKTQAEKIVCLIDGLGELKSKTTHLVGEFFTKDGKAQYKVNGFVIEVSDHRGFAHSEYSKWYQVYQKTSIFRKKRVFCINYQSASWSKPHYEIYDYETGNGDWASKFISTVSTL